MTQQEIDAQDRLTKVDAIAKRAEDLVGYLQSVMKTLEDALAALKESGSTVDLGPLKESIALAAETAREAFADVQALKSRFDSLSSTVSSQSTQLSGIETALTSINQRLAVVGDTADQHTTQIGGINQTLSLIAAPKAAGSSASEPSTI